MASEDIIYEILSRLPIKSLARFRCVSKSWLKYINDPYLRTIHVKEEPTLIMFQLIPRYDLNRMIKISFLLQQEPVLEMCYKDLSHGYIKFGSCNGLILMSYEQDPIYTGTYRFAVINPVSKQRHDLPPISIEIDHGDIYMDNAACESAGIGFDESTNTFKTVFLIVKNDMLCAMVHTSGTSTWREIAETPPYMIFDGKGVFGHGRLHWFGGNLLSPKDGDKIVWFDVKTEEFGLMGHPIPIKGNNNINDESIRLVDLNGEVGCGYTDPICIKLLILNEHDEWVLHCSFDLRLILPEYCYYDVDISGYWNKGGDILLTYNDGQRLFVYTLKTNDLREVEHPDPCVAYINMYQSSLFSVLKNAYSIKNF